MKKFTFSLQSVHQLREMNHEQEQLKLADIQVEQNEALSRLQSAEENRQKAMEQFSEKIESSHPEATELQLSMDYLTVLYHREREARNHLAKIEEIYDQQKQMVAEAARAAEVTAKLRERQHNRHKLEQLRHEQKELDEMVTLKSARNLLSY